MGLKPSEIVENKAMYDGLAGCRPVFLIRNEWRLQHYEHSREGQFRCEKKPWPKWPNCGILPSENPEMGWYNVLMVGPDGSFGGVFFFFEFLRDPKIDSFIWSLFAASETIHVFLLPIEKPMRKCPRSGCRSVKGMIVLRIAWKSPDHMVTSCPLFIPLRVGSKFVKKNSDTNIENTFLKSQVLNFFFHQNEFWPIFPIFTDFHHKRHGRHYQVAMKKGSADTRCSDTIATFQTGADVDHLTVSGMLSAGPVPFPCQQKWPEMGR